ncbi:hypothetical protein TVD_02535 [Thioalkalivibrio versutus]|uniref:DUF2189 domain-containing protein n=1 Tax=Thioalkalivibrio versutus TaxID=106634 RepID=A0A0G3G1P8_9GAMM|nr:MULTISPECIES: DUF2189 domain-containing protein [Thioalkalivibrio]AKJ94319.1 hypothetical protein TVD_02535 [Thioalkalivibrio versutus]
MSEEKDVVPMLQRAYPEDLGETVPEHTPETDSPAIREVATEDLGTWLGKGWRDLWQMPVALVHGLVITLAALILLGLSWNQPWMAFSLLAGILLLGPVLAVGVNYLALQKERGEPGGSGLGWLGPMGGSIWAFAALLAILFVIWASFVWMWIAVLNIGEIAVMGQLHHLVGAMLSSGAGIISLVGVVVAAIVFGLAVFALSLVTIPALLDHRIRDDAPQKSLIESIGVSLKAFSHNPGTLILWGLIITALFMVSVATALLALIVIFPWLGFAMWHAYRDLVPMP